MEADSTEHKELKRDFDVYWRIMKGTANITKKYFCPCLILSVLVEIDNIFVE